MCGRVDARVRSKRDQWTHSLYCYGRLFIGPLYILKKQETVFADNVAMFLLFFASAPFALVELEILERNATNILITGVMMFYFAFVTMRPRK